MPQPIPSPALRTLINDRLADLMARCRAVGVAVHDDAGVTERLGQLLMASDYAFDVLRRHPEWLSPEGIERLRSTADASARIDALQLPDDEAEALSRLRRFRHAEAIRLVFRDVNGLDDVEETLAATSQLYEALLGVCLAWSERAMARRYGKARDAAGEEQRLVVVGFGKLGGSELNFSSDVDLVLAYPNGGQSDGARPLDNNEYFIRLGRQLVRLLAEPTSDGICARVDLRLRPFGNAGRLALPFAAMEQYYQREGRDWERYAWIKARPVAGDRAAGRQLQDMLRPFVYRRYLDYTAFAGLREMKALIDAEVVRKDLAANLKLGPGGIREIEFIVQLTQMIRGGREPALRVRGLLPALTACEARGHIPTRRARPLREAYLFLRRLENRVQMLRDAQTHDIPDDELSRERIALGLGYANWPMVEAELASHREKVSAEFAAVLMPQGGSGAVAPAADTGLWRKARAGELEAIHLAEAGFPSTPEAVDILLSLPRGAAIRSMSTRSSERLDRLMPQLIAAARESPQPATVLARLCRLVQAVARRSSYLALLEEQPAARRRLVAVFARSAFLAERIIGQPLLLDDVLDPRIDHLPLKRADVAAEIGRALSALDERDAEVELDRLNELQSSLAFRLGLAFIDDRADATATARRLAALAEAVVAAVLSMAERELKAQHGSLPGPGTGFAVLGYGSLGGAELGFASDLDLVFVYDGARATARSDGARPLDGAQWYQRLAQRIVHWLGALTRGGKLYEIDTRLRPDGAKGLLVTSVDAFAGYQNERAWTWEHQALARARAIAGDAALHAPWDTLRETILRRPRDGTSVRTEVAAMRSRWRQERDRSDAARLDLKQGAGTLLDIEFLLQGLVLAQGAGIASLAAIPSSTPALLAWLGDSGALAPADAAVLERAHALFLSRALACTLDGRPRLAPREAALDDTAAQVLAVAARAGFVFS